ncbi:MAG: ATP-binding cassette domain-containing protein, partial [Acetobacter sp.]|nr:ATP-binding cassette domain-containing protein [Acetobacter sp.]
EFALVEEMTVAENIFIGSEIQRFGIINHQEMNHKAKELLDSFELNINPSTKIKELGVGHKQLVEIAKALSKNAKILQIGNVLCFAKQISRASIHVCHNF